MDTSSGRAWELRAIVWLGELLALLVVALAIVWPAPITRGTLPGAFAASDLPLSHWSSALTIKQGFASGRVPLWNDHYGGGRPLAGDPLAALWYPPTQLLRLLSVQHYFLVTIVGHLLLAGLGMLLLARVAFGLPRLAALYSAIAWMATPRLVAHLGAGHITIVQTAAWLPWVALTAWLTVGGPARWTPAFATCLAMMVLAGHPQIAYYGVLMLAGGCAWLVVQRWRDAGRAAFLRSAGGLLAGGSIAALLAAVHLLPMFEFVSRSTRQTAVGTTDATTVWPALKALAGFWMPSGVPHEAMFDPGRAVLALALVGLVVASRRVGVPLLLGIALIFGLAIGVQSPIFKVARLVLPDLASFRGVARIWFIALLAIAVLAGFGAAAVLGRVARRTPAGAAVLGIVGLVALAGNLVWTTHHLINVAEIEPLVTPNARELAIARAAGGGRTYGIQRNVRQPVAVALGLETLDGQDPLLIESYVNLMSQAGDYWWRGYELSVPPFQVYEPSYATFQYPQPDPQLLALLGVSVVASWFPIDDPLLEEVAYEDNTHIYRIALATVPARLYRPLLQAKELRRSGMQRQDTPINQLRRDAEHSTFTWTTTREGWLVLGWPTYPGWQAVLDGRRVSVRTVDGLLPAVWSPRGTHRLDWVYRPGSVRYGEALSILGLLTVAGWPIAGWAWRRTARPAHPRAHAEDQPAPGQRWDPI